MTDASNTVQILVACAMQGIRFSSINCLGWGGTKETGSQIKACAIYSIRFTRMNCVWWGNTMETVQLNKMCVIRSKQACNLKCVRRPIITQTIAANKPCVFGANAWWYIIVSDWWNHHRQVPRHGPCAMSLHTEQQHMYLYLIRTWFHKQIEHRITYVASTHMTFAHTKVRSKMPMKLK